VLVEVGEPEPLAGVPGRFRGWPTEVVVVGIGTFLTWQLGFDPRAGISTRDWPVTPQQSLAGQWRRIAQEEHFPGRADEVGDDLGRRVLVARLARDVMRLCFLLERRYAPYSKWLGTAFARLERRHRGPAARRRHGFGPVAGGGAGAGPRLSGGGGPPQPPGPDREVLGFRPGLCRQVGRIYDRLPSPPPSW
jgi:Domain of unknown function (DUF4037)